MYKLEYSGNNLNIFKGGVSIFFNKIRGEIIEKNEEFEIYYFYKIIRDSISLGVSDIHIEPFSNNCLIRFRIDGQLKLYEDINLSYYQKLVTQIKVKAHMDIDKKRIPQDGRYIYNEELLDIRVSSLPTIFGEKLVLRLLSKNKFNFDLESLGHYEVNKIQRLLERPNGLILVVGPTNSGKTTTIYSMIDKLNQRHRNIITIENPVEYTIENVNQVNINLKSGLTYSETLKSVLRQDPDIIMVGEIRDNETANLALTASITGHLVFSTLHTNDALSAISRLINMGIPKFLIADGLVGVISQRLIRKLCSCKSQDLVNATEARLFNFNKETTIYRPNGCNNCEDGFKNRTSISEIIEIDEEIKNMIVNYNGITKVKDYCMKNDTKFMKDILKIKILEGVTSFEEGKILSDI